jgi:hypothetical protein
MAILPVIANLDVGEATQLRDAKANAVPAKKRAAVDLLTPADGMSAAANS